MIGHQKLLVSTGDLAHEYRPNELLTFKSSVLMRKITKFDTSQLFDNLNLKAQKELSKTDARIASTFYSQFYKRVPREDLRNENSDDLYKLAIAHLNSARQK